MAWDDTQTTGDLLTATMWNNMVTDQENRGQPQQIDKRGSDFTGSNPSKELAITTSSEAKSEGIILFRNGRMLHETHEYTVSITSSTLTITLVDLSISDDDYFDGVYFI